MPILFSPRSTFPVVLDSDKELPDNEQPRFIFRALSVHEWTDLAAGRATKSENGAEAIATAIQQIRVGLVGWENMPAQVGSYDPEKLGAILTIHEVWELFFKFLNGNKTDADAKKNSESSP